MPFFIVMLQNHQYSPAATSGCAGTSAHETGNSLSFSFTGNPYEDFARLGLDLQNCHIRFLRKPRNNGVTMTGVFNICGIGYTAGATDYPSLLRQVHAKFLEKQVWHRRRRAEKRLRNTLSFINRYPDATVLPAWLC